MRTLVLVAALALSATAASAQQWELDFKTSELGPSRSIATLDSTNELPNSIGRPERVKLVFRCEGAKMVTYFAWPSYLGYSGHNQDAKFKFDDGQVFEETLGRSDGGDAFGYWETSFLGWGKRPGKGRVFLDLVMNSKRLVVATEPFQRLTQEAVFDLSEAKEALTQAQARCP